MKKIITFFLVIAIIAGLFAEEISAKNTETQIQDNNYYIIEFEISQSHFTLDFSEHIKDSMNKIVIEIPVDKDYYDNVRVGQQINETFRMGSLIMKGSIGKWKIIVKNKYTKKKQ